MYLFFQGTILHCMQTHTKKHKNLKAKYLKYRLLHVVVSRKLNNWTISNAIISSFFRLNKMQSTPFLLVSHFLAPDETAEYSTSRLHLKRTTENRPRDPKGKDCIHGAKMLVSWRVTLLSMFSRSFHPKKTGCLASKGNKNCVFLVGGWHFDWKFWRSWSLAPERFFVKLKLESNLFNP